MDALSFVLGAALALPGAAAGLGYAWTASRWRSRARLMEDNTRQLHSDVTRMDGDLADALARAHGAEEALKHATSSLDAGRSELADARKEAARIAADLASARAEVIRLDGEQARLRRLADAETSARRGVESSLQAAEGKLKAAVQDRATVAARLDAVSAARDRSAQEAQRLVAELVAVRRVLEALGLSLAENPESPLVLARRGATRALVSELAVDCDANATALVDRRGLPLFGSGSQEAVGRLGTSGALFAEVEASFGSVLCAPITTLSIATSVRGHHLVVVPGQPLLLAAESRPEAPLFGLRHAAIRLAGQVPPREAELGKVPAGVAPGERSPSLSALLGSWALRWHADAVALVEGDGSVVAANDDGLTAALSQARTAAGGVLRRLARDRWRLDDVEIRARTGDDAVLALRLRDDHPEGLAVVAIASHPIPTHALDELVASVRWSAREQRRAS
jgi:hypothetical protein